MSNIAFAVMEDSNKKPDDDKSIQSYAALGVGFVCLVIGLPLWWKTTEVYRVQLPYDEVAELASSPLTYAVEVQIVDFNAAGIENLVSHFRERLKSNLETSGHPEYGLNVKYDIHVRNSLDAEKRAVNGAKNLEELEVELDRIVGLPQNGNYTVYLLPDTSKLLMTASSLGRGRSAFVLTTRDEDSLLSLIEHIIRDVFVNEATLLRGYVSAKGAVHMQADKESMRGLRSYPGYEVTFTLLNPQPDMVRISWDIEDAIQRYLKPLLTAFAEYANIKVKSQFLHQAGLGVAAHRDTAGGGFFLAHTQLPHIINPVEAYLGSHVSNNPNLNFIVYIPTRDQSPLIIRDSSGNPSASNAFLSPRWGGLLIYNIDSLPANASLPVPVDIDMKKVMSVFASQLRLLLGIRPKTARDDVSLVTAGDRLITYWELDLWLREHCIQNIVTSAMTLQSLTDLLDKIGNIVINDEIGKQVDSAVKFIRKSKDYLERAKLKDAFLFAQKAMQASEAAFFDPSLLQLLYFPQDQKFAIYIPLFLPVGIPIVLSVLQAIKWMTRRQKEKKE